MGKIRYGLKNVKYAVYDEAEKKYGPWKDLSGAVTLTGDPQGNSTDFYADDVVYATIDGVFKETGTIEVAALEDEVLKELLGYETDEASGLTYDTTEPKNITFALGYENGGNVTRKRGVRYNVKLSRPNENANSMAESTTPDTQTLNYTAIGRDFTVTTGTGDSATTETKNVLKAQVEESGNKATFDAFFSKVLCPGMAIA